TSPTFYSRNLTTPPHPPSLLFFLQYSPHHRDLHSFPTRRSSDLMRLDHLPTGKQGADMGAHHGLERHHATGGRGHEPGEGRRARSEEHTSELQSRFDLVCRLLLEKKKKKNENKDVVEETI